MTSETEVKEEPKLMEPSTPKKRAELMTVNAAPSLHVSMRMFNSIREQAAVLIKTGFLPQHIRTPEQAVAVVLMGRELGVPMMQSLRKIYVVQGTPALASELMLALANRTGEVEDFEAVDVAEEGGTAVVTLKRKGRKPHVERFSMKDAQSMGLAYKDNWKKQARIMRRWRAIAAACRVVFPDAVGGMYTLEEVAPDVPVDQMGYAIGDIPESAQPDLPKPTLDVKTVEPAAKAAPAEPPDDGKEQELHAKIQELLDLLANKGGLNKAEGVKWLKTHGFPTTKKQLTLDVVTQAIAKAEEEFSQAKPPAEEKKDPARQKALAAIFGHREKALFPSDDALREWAKSLYGKGLSEMTAEELDQVKKHVQAISSLLTRHGKWGFNSPAELITYISDSGNEKGLHGMTLEEIEKFEKDLDDLL